jgi:HEAT repeat protein
VTQAVAASPAPTGRQGEVTGLLDQLRSPQEQARMAALTQLGRMKATDAVSPVIRILNEDASPQVREAAARALGLIGAETALPALQHAALDDNDRDVRHSASYAADVIRASLQGSR